MLGKNGEVPNAVVYLEGITAGKKKALPEKVQLDQKECEYVPHVLLVPPNAEVEILNSDPMLHNVHTYKCTEPKTTIFNLAFPLKGQKVTRKLTEAGKILSLCDAGHPWMSAHIVVAEHPYYAITNAEGIFVLDNVPPGKYTLKLWHEGTPQLQNNSNAAFLKTKPREFSKPVSVSKKQTVAVNFEL
jgi:plastocyanin